MCQGVPATDLVPSIKSGEPDEFGVGVFQANSSPMMPWEEWALLVVRRMRSSQVDEGHRVSSDLVSTASWRLNRRKDRFELGREMWKNFENSYMGQRIRNSYLGDYFHVVV